MRITIAHIVADDRRRRMSTKIQVAAIALLTFGALGLGLLGADAAGLGGNVLPTPTSTPTATATPTPTPGIATDICFPPPIGTGQCFTPTPTPTPSVGDFICFPPPIGTGQCFTPTPTPTPSVGDFICFPPPIGTVPCDTPTPTPTPTPAPTGIFWAVDCDLSTPGVQGECDVPLGTGSLEVGVVLGNAGILTPHVAAFNFVVHDPDTGRLDPPPGADLDRNSNPDLDESEMTGQWQCTPPAPDNDTGQDGPGAAASFLSCINPSAVSTLPVLGPGGLRLAKVRYDIPAGADPGSVLLTMSQVAAADADVAEFGACPGDGGLPVVPCLSARINLVPATATVTATATATSTATATPAPCVGDVNGDGKVNVLDLVAVTRHLRTRPPDLRFDVNHDGKLNSLDLIVVIKNMRKRC
jgi:hypothetical protein